jgi:3'-5' exoribonuclease
MDKIPKRKLISEYGEGDIVRDVFVVKIRKGVVEYSKGYSFALVLSDSSGKSIDYKYWGPQDESAVRFVYDSVKDDSVVLVVGAISSYQGKLQISSNDPGNLRVLQKGEYEESDFIKKTGKNIDEMYSRLEGYVEKVANPKLKTLVATILEGDVKEKFKRQPAAISIHHNWIGGLLEHILEVLSYCELSKKLYPQLDEDLLIVGAILHDIGKLEEMEMTTRIKGTNIGMFTGHILLGSIFVSNKMDENGIDGDLKQKILHMIASHHGSVENGSLREPMFPEAVALHQADEMSSKLAEMLGFVEESKSDTEDDFKPKWPKKRPTNIFLR